MDHRAEDRSLLLRGSDLKDAEAFLVTAQGMEPAPTPAQARFIQASRQGASRRQRRAVAIAVCVALLAATLGVFAWQQRGEAIDQRQTAEARAAESRSRELASASVGQLQVDPELSLLLASEAMKAERTPEAVDALRQAIAESRVRATFIGHDGPIGVVEYSADGLRLLTASYDGTARIWDLVEDADPIVLSGHTDLLVGASFNADGTEVATASFDGTARVNRDELAHDASLQDSRVVPFLHGRLRGAFRGGSPGNLIP